MIDSITKIAEEIARKKAGEFAPGIPESRARSEIPTIKAPVLWTMAEQKHDADRAGLHYDLRLSDGSTAYSWAIRKGLPAIGERRLAIRQPDHDHSYISFQGQLGKGYGSGRVYLNRLGMMSLLKSSPSSVRWAALDKKNPQEFLMVHTPAYGKDAWQVQNVTPTVEKRPDVPLGKPKFDDASPSDLPRFMSDRYALSSKIDGAHMTVHFGDRVEVFSQQPSVTGELVNHSYVFGVDEPVPASLKGTKVRAEAFAVKGKTVLPNRELAGLLNSSPGEVLRRMKDEGIQLVLAPIKMIADKGKPVDAAPYKDHIRMMSVVAKQAPGHWMMPDIAITLEDKKKLAEKIRTGKHPLTEEGMVAWPLKEVGARPTKLKYVDHFQVYIQDVYPMMSGGKPTELAGGFWYSLTPSGPSVGKVGTGFSDVLRKEMWEGRKDLKGRKVVIESLGRFPSGAYRAPSFVSFHL